MQLLDARAVEALGLGSQTAVLAALSGGADSTALLLELCRLSCEGVLGRITACHVHHGIRGAEADADASFCRSLCARIGVGYREARVDALSFAKENGQSLEQAARTLRYRELGRVAAEEGCGAVAAAHHRGDQAETVLLHLIRGSGLRGLCGMRKRNGDLVRPLLDVDRADILRYLEERGQAYCVDSTNAMGDAARNRVRNEVLPLLQTLNPAIVPQLCGMAERLYRDEAELSRQAAAARTETGDDRHALAALPEPLRDRVLLEMLRAGDDSYTQRDVNTLAALLTAENGTTVDLGGSRRAWVENRVIRIGTPPETEAYATALAPGGTVTTPCGRLTARWVDAAKLPCGANEAYLDADCIRGGLTVRPPMRGERFRPLGLGGGKLLSDYFGDRKVPRYRRNVPLVCDEDGVLYVAGHTIDERARVTGESRRVLHISYEEEAEHVGQ